MKRLLAISLWILPLFFIACEQIETGSESIVLESLKITPASTTIRVGESVQLSAISVPSYSNDFFSWSSTSDAIATVDNNGVVTAIRSGSVKIFCKHL